MKSLYVSGLSASLLVVLLAACAADEGPESNDPPTQGECQSDAECSDGVFCNGAEVCANGSCAAGTAPDCDDDIACTADSCDGSEDACVHVTQDAECDDGSACNGVESCDVAAGCVAGTPVDCVDDGIDCTVDACAEPNGTCGYSPSDALCPPGETCVVEQGGCTPKPPCAIDADCDDGKACNGVETCLAGVCEQGEPLACDDGISCTDDTCDAELDACLHAPNHTRCSDEAFCNGDEVCDVEQGCLPGAPPACDDGLGCTVDACDATSDECVHDADHTVCDDGKFCNGAEQCDVIAGCKAGIPPACDDGKACTSDACSTDQNDCVHTPVHAFCDDGLHCNGEETCSASAADASGCVAGTTVSCDPDGTACTADVCSEVTQACAHTPRDELCSPTEYCDGAIAGMGCVQRDICSQDAHCDDGNPCNGAEICDMSVCRRGTPVNCDDDIACTIDACNPATGACTRTLNHEYCDDGFTCNGSEVCSETTGCVPGATVDCDDSEPCTLDTCEEPSGACAHLENASLCEG